MLIVFQNSAFHNALLADMPKCTQVCPHGAGEEDLAAEVPADPDPVPTASAADPMGKRGTGHWPLEHFSLNVTFWACLRSHCINRCLKHHRLRFQCFSNRILPLPADVLGNRPETTNFFFLIGASTDPVGTRGSDPVPTASATDPMGKRGTGHWPLEHFSLNVTFWACLQSHCNNMCLKHHRLTFQCSSNRIFAAVHGCVGKPP